MELDWKEKKGDSCFGPQAAGNTVLWTQGRTRGPVLVALPCLPGLVVLGQSSESSACRPHRTSRAHGGQGSAWGSPLSWDPISGHRAGWGAVKTHLSDPEIRNPLE